MIKDPGAWEIWENNFRKTPVDFAANLKILEALFEEAQALHLFPLKDPLQGLDIKIHLARVINVSKAA